LITPAVFFVFFFTARVRVGFNGIGSRRVYLTERPRCFALNMLDQARVPGGHCVYVDGLSRPEPGTRHIDSTFCSMSTSYVEVKMECNRATAFGWHLSCAVSRMRSVPDMPLDNNTTTLSIRDLFESFLLKMIFTLEDGAGLKLRRAGAG